MDITNHLLRYLNEEGPSSIEHIHYWTSYPKEIIQENLKTLCYEDKAEFFLLNGVHQYQKVSRKRKNGRGKRFKQGTAKVWR